MNKQYLILLIISTCLTACGQFGKLYLPEPAPMPPTTHANEEPTTL